MAHVVTEKCNGCKFTDCVEVCPVACFYEMDTQVVIHPDDCIDCMACVEVCPVHAIYADADVPTEFTKDIEYNAVESVPDQGLRRAGNHSPQRCAAHRERPEKSSGILDCRASVPVPKAFGIRRMEPLGRERHGSEVGRPSERERASQTPYSIRVLRSFPVFLLS